MPNSSCVYRIISQARVDGQTGIIASPKTAKVIRNLRRKSKHEDNAATHASERSARGTEVRGSVLRAFLAYVVILEVQISSNDIIMHTW